MQLTGRKACISVLWAAAAALSACSSPANRAPVVDYNTPAGAPAARPVTPVVTLPPVASNPVAVAAKPGYYVVQQGDTIRRIAATTHQPWREIVRWNKLDNPDRIEPGQMLRVTPSGDTGAPAVVAAASPKTAQVQVATQTTPGVAAAPAKASTAPSPKPHPISAGADDIAFIWPVKGALLAGFDEDKNKGLDIAGKVGEPVFAAADGKVLYAGAGLRGYGNLIILKHNNTFLTAYAHNQKLLVKQDETVKKGQKIAEMGATDADRVQLHFEIRRSGKPVDPARYLPPR